MSRRGRQVAAAARSPSPTPPLPSPAGLSRQRGSVATRGGAGGRAAGRRAPLTRHVSEDLAVQVGELAAEDVGAGRHGGAGAGAGAGPGRGAARCRRTEPGTAAEAEGTARARGPPGRRRAAAMRAGAVGKWSLGRGGASPLVRAAARYRGRGRGHGGRGAQPLGTQRAGEVPRGRPSPQRRRTGEALGLGFLIPPLKAAK